MTPAISYDEIHSNVEAELQTLQAEKEQLEGQRQNIEQRLEEIIRHEEKLRRVFESLADLLAVYPPVQTLDQSREVNPVPFASAIDEALLIEQSGTQQVKAISMNQEETTAPSDLDGSTNEESESLVSAVQVVEDSASVAQELGTYGSSMSEASPSEDSAANSADTSADEEKILRRVADFDAQDFSARFPYITTTHPVHFLAGKLLEYFGYGLKLAEIARLIELIGYRHNSRNFTDSVHSALKNKRKTTGEFRFNAKKSVWELSHWAMDNQNGGNLLKTERVDTAVSPQQEPKEDWKSRALPERRRAAKQVAGKGAVKGGANRSIKVLKSQK